MSADGQHESADPLPWLEVRRGAAPLVVSFPHTGTDVPAEIESRLSSPWLARRDTDWWVHHLYEFVHALGATSVRSKISRTVIDLNRNPDGSSLYPGQNTTGLCPLATFDDQPLYRPGQEPDAEEIAQRQQCWFDPYHQALAAEIARLRERHPCVVVYDAHSIRSVIPHLFPGRLPQFNIGTTSGSGTPDSSCDPRLALAVQEVCAASGLDHVRNGRFRGGWITRHYAAPARGVHAIQMELACRGYMDEPGVPSPGNWPTPMRAPEKTVQGVLSQVMDVCLAFARGRATHACPPG
jgi:N-formylglutamate deformylase